jgi:hypothetical protein
MMLHTALTAAGHSEYDEVRTSYDINMDEVWVRFESGTKPDGKLVQFRIPASLFDPVEFDPVEYARAKWPHWFVDKSIKENTDVS